MRVIQLKKFGTVLVSRPAGLEAFNAIRPHLVPNEPVQVDFEGVLAVTPSWLDEFLTHLVSEVGEHVTLLSTKNASVTAVLPVLNMARQDAVARVIRRALEKK